MREWLGVYARGLCMGAADAVPGVSGGTIALITGIYGRLIAALTAVRPDRILGTLRAAVARDRETLVEGLLEMDVPFLVTLGTGVVTAVILVTGAVEAAVETRPATTFAFFFGLILASAVVLYDEVDLATWDRRAAALAGFLVAFVASGSAAADLGGSLLVVFLAGAVSVSAMVLPGVSGSLLLIILGQYTRMIDALHTFLDALTEVATGAALATVLDPGRTVVVFVTGAFVGLFTVAHAVRYALEADREATVAFLVSLIVGGLRAPTENVVTELDVLTAGTVAPVVVAAVVGAVLVVGLDHYAGTITY